MRASLVEMPAHRDWAGEQSSLLLLKQRASKDDAGGVDMGQDTVTKDFVCYARNFDFFILVHKML